MDAERRALHGARRALEVAGRAALGLYGGWSRLRGHRPQLPLRPGSVRRVLVIRLDLMGDVVFSLPTLRALWAAFPGARVDALVLPYTAPMVARCAGVGRIYTLDVNAFRRPRGLRHLPALAAVLAQMRSQRYDIAFGLSGLTGGIFAALSGAAYRVGYQGEAFWGCYNLPVPGRRYMKARHEVEYCLDLVRAVAGGTAELPPLSELSALDLSDAPPTPLAPDRSAARRYAVLVPGASNGSAKRWPVEYWSALADRLAGDRGLAITLTGSAAERPLAAKVVDGMAADCVNAAGETDVEGLMRLLSEAAVVVAGDTGPLHLASALGRPVVGIFGPTDPTNTGPPGASARTLRLGLACSPCYDLRGPAECKLPDRSVACMWGVRPEKVYDAVCELLDGATTQEGVQGVADGS